MGNNVIYFYTNTLDSTCGVGLFYNFQKKRNTSEWGAPDTVDTFQEDAGCGWYVAGFIDTKECQQAYEEMCAKFILIYQSPVRVNRNSGREFFFCIFDAGEREDFEDENEVDYDGEDDGF